MDSKIVLRRLLFLLMLTHLFGCQLDGIHESILAEQANNDESSTDDIANAKFRLAGLLFQEDFESGRPFLNVEGLEIGANHSLTYVNKPNATKGHAARFELRYNDPIVKGSKRAEVTIVKGEHGDIGKDTWYAFDLYVPTDYVDESKKELISQWHQDGDASAGINIKNGRFFWRFYINGKKQDYDLGAIKKGQWNNFVIHMLHSYGSDGITELWLNDKKLLDLKGRNMNNEDLPKGKIGIYKSNWLKGKTKVDRRVLYFDNIKVGDKQAIYSLMTSGSNENISDAINPSPTPSPSDFTENDKDKPSGSEIESLIFVNAEYERDIYALTEGRSLSLSKQDTYKISVRANTSSSVGSVKFELNGKKKFVYTDNVNPYALFGDDSNGNYYYGPGMSPGKYTLTVTAYSQDKGMGNMLERKTVNFIITK